MAYYIKNKISGRNMEGFDDYWRAEETISKCYDTPSGYTFKSDVYEIVDENGIKAQKPEEEKLPYCISCVHGELPETFFKESEANKADEFEFYTRELYFDTFKDAEAELEKYECTKARHKSTVGDDDLIQFRQYFIEDNDTREVLKIAKWALKDKDWRGGMYEEYDCYAPMRH